MTKVISIFICILLAYGGWELYKYWLRVDAQQPVDPDIEAAQRIYPESLDGMPKQIEGEYKAAVAQGPTEMKKFLKKYAKNIQDPRLAWIELDYMVSIVRTDPQEAQAIFADVKGRIAETDRIYPRIRLLSKTMDKKN